MPPQPLEYERTKEIPASVRRPLYARKIMGIITLFTLAIFAVNLPDGSRFQFEAGMLFMLSLVLFLITLFWVWGARAEARRRARP